MSSKKISIVTSKRGKTQAPPIPLALSRTLGTFTVTLLGVGALLGGGIFTLIGPAAGLAGMGLVIAIALGAVIAFLNLQAYVALSTAFPAAGGGYQWIRHGIGEFPGFLSGWMSWFANTTACGLYALSFGFYASVFFFDVLNVPDAGMSHAFWTKLFTLSIVILFAFVNYRGAAISGQAGSIITVILLGILGFFIVSGFVVIAHDGSAFQRFSPFFSNGMLVGLFGIAQAAALFYIAFEGSEIQAQSGEEIKDPVKSLKTALFSSWGIVSFLYAAISFILLAAVSSGAEPVWRFLEQAGEGAIIVAAKQFMPWGGFLMVVGGLLANVAALNATIYSSSHISFAMARDKVIFPIFSRIHAAYKTPHLAIIASTALTLAMVLFLPITDVASAATLLYVGLFFMLNLAYIQLRRKHDEAKWKYTPFGFPAVPLAAMAAYMVLGFALFQVSPVASVITLIWIMLGIINFFAFSEQQEREDFDREIVYERTVRLGEKKRHRILIPLVPEIKWEKFHTLAFALARQFKSEIILSRIFEVPPSLPLSEGVKDYGHNRQLLDQIIGKIEEENRARREDTEPVDVHSLMMVGRSIVSVVLETVHLEDCDMLILGWSGYTKTKGTIFGNKIDTMLKEARCDLLVVKSGIPENPRRILIPISPYGSQHLRFTGKIASGLAHLSSDGGRITLFSVISPSSSVRQEEEALGALHRLQMIMKIDPAIRVSFSVKRHGSVSTAVIEESAGYDLIIAPASRGRFFRQIRMGNIPEIVAKLSKTPVILVKGHYGILPSAWGYIKERF